MKLTLLTLLTVIAVSACSSRTEYSRPRAASPPDAVDINSATVDQLEKLPHIGRKTAEAIVQYRTDNGPFRRVEHLMLIRGVSENRFAELKAVVRIGDE